MRKQILALMDSEEPYAIRFMEHVNRKKTTPFEVHAFTSRERLEEYVSSHHVEILLISEHDLEETFEYPASQVIILTDHSEGNALYPNVCKYQASSQVMKQVIEVYGRKADSQVPSKDAVIKPPTKIIGVFSPCSRCGKTSFALALGQCLSSKKASLYLNFEIASGLKSLLKRDWPRDLSDIIYYIRRGDRNLTARLLPLVQDLGTMSYVPPCPSPSEIYSVEFDEWHRLFESLRRDSSYEILILDLGMLPLFMPEILEECDLIYFPLAEDETARAKLEDFRFLLSEHEVSIDPRVRHPQIPEAGAGDSMRSWAEQLLYGPVGNCAKEWIRRDQL